jgi:hypothetical protein
VTIVWQTAAFLSGVVIVIATVMSAVRTIVMPHGRSANLTRFLFVTVRRVLSVRRLLPASDGSHHEWQSLYAPLTLVLLPLVWISTSLAGFTLIFWSLGIDEFTRAFKFAGSAMLTIGFADTDRLSLLIATFTAAGLTISLFALLLVTYLPTMYQAYSARETALAALETFAGEPADPADLLIRHHRIGALDRLDKLWTEWQGHFFELRETHTALPAVALFRSSTPERHWVRSAEALLDAAALWNSTCIPDEDPEASLCIRAGSLALADIARFFRIEIPHRYTKGDPISIEREHFDALVARLDRAGVPLVSDLDEAWADWAGWRVNYDQSVIALSTVTSAPSNDRQQR